MFNGTGDALLDEGSEGDSIERAVYLDTYSSTPPAESRKDQTSYAVMRRMEKLCKVILLFGDNAL